MLHRGFCFFFGGVVITVMVLLLGCPPQTIPPSADFTSTAVSGTAPLTVHFTDVSRPGSAAIYSWIWDFGDGGMSTEQNPSHTYANEGVYTVSLTIETVIGDDVDTKNDYITVSAAQEGPTAAFSADRTTGESPLEVQFTDASIAGSNPITSWTWDFGDGGTSTEQNPSHTFVNEGDYTVSLTVSTSVDSDSETKADLILVSESETTWQRYFGEGGATEQGLSGQQTLDGGYVFAGVTNSYGAGSSDMYLVKTNASGYQVWAATFGGTEYDKAYCVQQTSDGGYILAGETKSFGVGGRDVYLVKVDALGNEEWSNTFGTSDDDVAYCVQETMDGGYIVAGSQKSPEVFGWDALLIKTDSFGNDVWSKAFGDEYTHAYCVRQTDDGGYILAGSEDTEAFSVEACLIKTDAQGVQMWKKTYGGNAKDHANCVQQTDDGGFVFVGVANNTNSSAKDAYIVKTDTIGNEVWSKTLGTTGASLDAFRFIEQTADGGYIIVGDFDNDPILLKTDAVGSEEWLRNFNFTLFGNCVRQLADGGYIVVGLYSPPYSLAWLMKTGADGTCQSNSPTNGNPTAE